VKKAYAKVKARQQSGEEDIYQQRDSGVTPAEPASLELHPDRQAMLDRPSPTPKPARHTNEGKEDVNRFRHRSRRPKPSSYSREAKAAEQTRLEAEARRKLREEKDKDRQAMSKARRPDKEGRYRLGRQSKVLLSRVQRMVAG
jgi:hypothetical protein